MEPRAGVLTDHIRTVADRSQRIRGLIELAERLDIDAKITTKKSGDTVITIPAKAGK